MTNLGVTAKGLGATAKSLGAKTLVASKALAFSPVVGVIALGAVIGYELWQGKKDSDELMASKQSAH